MKKILFIIIFFSIIYASCGDKENNNPSSNCPEQKMPDPTKETNFVACKIDGKVWRDQPLKWWSPLSAELDYADLPWCKQCATIIGTKRIENECDSIRDQLVIDWSNNKIGINKIDFVSFLQSSNKYKKEHSYKLDTSKPYKVEVTLWDSIKNKIAGNFFFTLKGKNTSDTLKVSEGIFKIGQ